MTGVIKILSDRRVVSLVIPHLIFWASTFNSDLVGDPLENPCSVKVSYPLTVYGQLVPVFNDSDESIRKARVEGSLDISVKWTGLTAPECISLATVPIVNSGYTATFNNLPSNVTVYVRAEKLSIQQSNGPLLDYASLGDTSAEQEGFDEPTGAIVIEVPENPYYIDGRLNLSLRVYPRRGPLPVPGGSGDVVSGESNPLSDGLPQRRPIVSGVLNKNVQKDE